MFMVSLSLFVHLFFFALLSRTYYFLVAFYYLRLLQSFYSIFSTNQEWGKCKCSLYCQTFCFFFKFSVSCPDVFLCVSHYIFQIDIHQIGVERLIYLIILHIILSHFSLYNSVFILQKKNSGWFLLQ